MAWSGLNLTVEGRKALNQAQLNNRLNFKSIVVGDGNPPSNFSTQKQLVHQLYELTELKIDITENKCVLTADFPNVDYDYYFREIGIIVTTENGDKLYVYDNCGNDAQYIVTTTGTERTEKRLRLILMISDVEHITVSESSILYVAYDEYEKTITELKQNKLDSEGGDISDTIVKFTESQQTENICSGEKLGIIFSKIQKALKDCFVHITSAHVTGVKGSAESIYRTGDVEITAENVGALSLKNGGNVTGDTSFQGKRRVHYVDDGTGRAGYDKIARFTANSAYNNAAIEIELARRTDTVPTRVAIMFAGNACYAVTCMGHTKDIFMCKESDGVWVLYVKKTHEWCTTSVLDYVHSPFADGVTVEWIVSSSANYAESLPNTEIISGTWGYIVKEAMEAGNVNWNGITDKPSTYPPSDGSGYYVKNENLSDIDLNNVTTTGIYHLAGNLVNNPESCNATLIVDFNVGTPYQLFIPDYNYRMYKRVKSNGNWSSWTSLFTWNNLEGKPVAREIGIGTASNFGNFYIDNQSSEGNTLKILNTMYLHEYCTFAGIGMSHYKIIVWADLPHIDSSGYCEFYIGKGKKIIKPRTSETELPSTTVNVSPLFDLQVMYGDNDKRNELNWFNEDDGKILFTGTNGTYCFYIDCWAQ